LVGVDDRAFWDGVQQRRLVLERCGDCGAMRHPPRPMCPECGSLARATFDATGRGRVLSYVIPRHPLPPGFDDPLVIGLVELEEGARLVSNLAIDPDDVRNDMAVEVRFDPVDDDGLLMHRFVAVDADG
jgi:uncharacterized OB-fold protein